MKYYSLFVIFSLLIFQVLPGTQVTEVNFLDSIKIKHNGFGPLMVKYDEGRNRVILINTNSSSISLINGRDKKVVNIPVDGRAPQYLKEESFAINKKNGNIYMIGRKTLCIVYPESKTSTTFNTRFQYEMVAIDDSTGNCFLAGRESREIAFLDLKKGKFRFVKSFNRTEKMMNLNQTPPPPIRKIVADPELRKVFVFDGYTSSLYILDITSGKKIGKRVLNIKKGKRFHFAGFDHLTHHLYLVTETEKRKVVQALKIDCLNGNDIYVDLPELTEGVGINLNVEKDEIYIPYDNHPAVHIVNFKEGGSYIKVEIPSYGNDATAIDKRKNLLYVASWAYGEIYVIDLKKQKLIKRIRNIGILPHMFSIAFDPESNSLYIPLGATAVNGSFGSAITVLDTNNWEKHKIRTGWAPIDLIEQDKDGSFLVFNTESEFAKVMPDGNVEFHKLPFPYPVAVAKSAKGNTFLSYGPHQSYWPAVYIWGAKNGILEIEKETFQVFDRRIPRLAQKIVFDKRDGLYGLQNSWGKENFFLTFFPDGIRMFSPQERIYFYTSIQRENIPRILKYDEEADNIYVVRTGEKDTDGGSLLIINAKDNLLRKNIRTGLTPTDLQFDKSHIYISNFDSDSVTKVDKKTFETSDIRSGEKPLRILKNNNSLFVMNHIGKNILIVGEKRTNIMIPNGMLPDNMVLIGNTIYISAHNSKKFSLFSLDPETRQITNLFNFSYPYGDTSFNNSNTAFYLRGQFGDSIYEISQIKAGKDGKIWVTDLLSGRLFIIEI